MTDSVKRLVEESGYPNMKVIEFAFDERDTGNASDYLPHNYTNCLLYTSGKSDDSQVINGKTDNFLLVEKEHRNLPREKYKGNSDQCSPAYQKPNGNMVS